MELNARSLSSVTFLKPSANHRKLLNTRLSLLKPKLRSFTAKKSEGRSHGETDLFDVDGSDRLPENFLVKSALATAAAVLVSTSGCDAQALAESLTVAFPVSKAREVNTVQRTLIEVWGLVRETFIDPTFNHQDWDSKLQQTMVEMFPLKSADAAYSKIRGMLWTLGDPFTKLINPKEYQSFRIGSDGNLQGIGLFINVEPHSGHLVVLSCIEGSPAARAGIHEGDELLEIDGESVAGINSEAAAQKLRGRIGTTVTVKLLSVIVDDKGDGSSDATKVVVEREKHDKLGAKSQRKVSR